MPTFTTNYSIPKPVPGADADTWGAALNSGMDIIDTQLAGRVGGASALTTVGSVPFVTAAGVLGQSGNLFWDNANGRLGVGTNAPQRPAHIRNAGGLRIDTASSGFDLTNTNTGEWQITAVNSISRFGILGSLWTHSATGNVALGTTTDGGFKLDVGDSGSSGGLRVWDQRATIGSTSLVVRAGAGQGGNNLQTWQTSGGTVMAGVSNDGNLGTTNQLAIWTGALFGGTQNVGINNVGVDVGSAHLFRFSSTGNSFGTKDLSLSRASANTLQVGDGGANALGTLNAARVNLGTNATVPLIIGGTGVLSTLVLRSTSGVGTTGADIIFQTGTNGSTEAMRILNNGNVGITTPSPKQALHVAGQGLFSSSAAAFDPGDGAGPAARVGYSTSGDFGYLVSSETGVTVKRLQIMSQTAEFITAGAERMRVENVGLKVGGIANRSTTAGTNQVIIFDGTAPVGTLANGCSFYSTAGEMRVMDAAGNATLLSPHDKATNEWVYDSTHTPTGKRLKISVEKLLRFVNEHFNLDCILEEDPAETMA